LDSGTDLLSKRGNLSQRCRVVTDFVCVLAFFQVLPPCWCSKRQEQQCGKDAFHAGIERLAVSNVNKDAARLYFFSDYGGDALGLRRHWYHVIPFF